MKKMMKKMVAAVLMCISLMATIATTPITTGYAATEDVNAVLDFGEKNWSLYYPGICADMTGGTAVPHGLKEGTELQVLKTEVNSKKNEVAYCYVPSADVYCYISNCYVKELMVETVTKETMVNTYTYDGKEYLLVEGFDEKYLFDQKDYSRFVENGKNVGCTATALATAYSIYNNSLLSPDSESIKWTTGVGVTWSPQSIWTGYASNNLTALYDYLQKGIPVILRLKKGNNGHSITVIGVEKNSKRSSLTTSDFIVADPWGGVIKPLKQASIGYTLHPSWDLIIPVKK